MITRIIISELIVRIFRKMEYMILVLFTPLIAIQLSTLGIGEQTICQAQIG